MVKQAERVGIIELLPADNGLAVLRVISQEVARVVSLNLKNEICDLVDSSIYLIGISSVTNYIVRTLSTADSGKFQRILSSGSHRFNGIGVCYQKLGHKLGSNSELCIYTNSELHAVLGANSVIAYLAVFIVPSVFHFGYCQHILVCPVRRLSKLFGKAVNSQHSEALLTVAVSPRINMNIGAEREVKVIGNSCVIERKTVCVIWLNLACRRNNSDLAVLVQVTAIFVSGR